MIKNNFVCLRLVQRRHITQHNIIQYNRVRVSVYIKRAEWSLRSLIFHLVLIVLQDSSVLLPWRHRYWLCSLFAMLREPWSAFRWRHRAHCLLLASSSSSSSSSSTKIHSFSFFFTFSSFCSSFLLHRILCSSRHLHLDDSGCPVYPENTGNKIPRTLHVAPRPPIKIKTALSPAVSVSAEQQQRATSSPPGAAPFCWHQVSLLRSGLPLCVLILLQGILPSAALFPPGLRLSEWLYLAMALPALP